MATIQLTGFVGTGSDFTLGDDRFVPILDINNVFQEQGSLTWTKGAHNVKVGATLIRRQLNYFQNTFGHGILPVSPKLRCANLEHLIREVRRTKSNWQMSVITEQHLRFWEPAVYVQDDWHAKSWLTLNLGLRWDHFSPITDSNGERSNFNIASNLRVLRHGLQSLRGRAQQAGVGILLDQLRATLRLCRQSA